MDSTSEIREFLTTRKGEWKPEDANLPIHGKRRVPGLRREEAATPGRHAGQTNIDHRATKPG